MATVLMTTPERLGMLPPGERVLPLRGPRHEGDFWWFEHTSNTLELAAQNLHRLSIALNYGLWEMWR